MQQLSQCTNSIKSEYPAKTLNSNLHNNFVKSKNNNNKSLYGADKNYFYSKEQCSSLRNITFCSLTSKTQIIQDIYQNVLTEMEDRLLKSKDNPKRYDEMNKALNTILESKPEALSFINGIYTRLEDRYKFPERNYDFSKWKPCMPLEDAKKYVKGTREENEFYYRGSRHIKEEREVGYQNHHISPSYPGIYVGDDKTECSTYGGNALTLKIRIKNVAYYDDYEYIIKSELNKIQNEELKSTLSFVSGIIGRKVGEKLNIDAYSRRVQAFDDDPVMRAYAIINPKNIVIVE